MTVRIRFRPEAEAELNEAISWYDARGPGLGSEFFRSVEGSIALIARHPEMHPVAFGNARRAMIRRFPYSLIYVHSAEEVLIVACMYGGRDPRRWQSRL